MDTVSLFDERVMFSRRYDSLSKESDMDLAVQIEVKREFGELICQKLRECIEKINFPAGTISSYPDYQTVRFEQVQDPFTGLFNLSGSWYEHRGQRMGRLQFQSDESCYAEYAVGKPHPDKPQWFVDNVIAWGKINTLTTEPALLRFPE